MQVKGIPQQNTFNYKHLYGRAINFQLQTLKLNYINFQVALKNTLHRGA